MPASPNKVPYYAGVPLTKSIWHNAGAESTPESPTNYNALLSGGESGNGVLVDGILFTCPVTCVDGLIYIYLYNGDTTAWYCHDMVTKAARTISGTVPGQSVLWLPQIKPMVLRPQDGIAFAVTEDKSVEPWVATLFAAAIDMSGADGGQTHPL